jgi:hypothetical protein
MLKYLKIAFVQLMFFALTIPFQVALAFVFDGNDLSLIVGVVLQYLFFAGMCRCNLDWEKKYMWQPLVMVIAVTVVLTTVFDDFFIAIIGVIDPFDIPWLSWLYVISVIVDILAIPTYNLSRRRGTSV